VMTGFRLALGGAQERYQVKPDMTTMGKIIGGGLPVGAYGGKKEIMDCVSPVGPVYQAGTLSGNPLAMAAGLAMLKYLKQHPEVYSQIDSSTTLLTEGLAEQFKEAGIPHRINKVGSMFTLFFTDQEVINFDTAKTSDTALFGKYFQAMSSRGVYLAPSQYEAMFISTSITKEVVSKILDANRAALKDI
jgi:glutamate-1-semialdehyde 2,1-aminomutase